MPDALSNRSRCFFPAGFYFGLRGHWAVTDNRMRHEAIKQFMLINDSVTVAMEVPVYLSRDDLKHFTQKLKFKTPLKLESTLTGHIDILQIRNGLIHILAFKPNARKEKPYTQFMLYALALSRLTGLRLFDFHLFFPNQLSAIHAILTNC